MANDLDLSKLLQELSPENAQKVREYVEYLQWQERQTTRRDEWKYDFVENFASAKTSATRDGAGMEIKAANAVSGGVTRPALWEHPPVVGAASISYAVAIQPELRGLQLRFAIGIRDGSEMPADRYVAFRVMVNGWKLWSAVKNSQKWDEYQVAMPELSSDVARIEFITDGLGDHRWNWAVWGEPRLTADL